MVFGELVIPSSRSLWDDDYTELTPYTPVPIKWEDDNRPFPSEINTLIVADTKPIIDIFKKCVIGDLAPYKSSVQNGLNLYDLNNNIYLLTYENKPNYTSGEVISHISTLIDNTRNLYGITSLPIAIFQGSEALNEETCTIFSLCTEGIQIPYRTLQIPNVITGICANLLSYRLSQKKSCAVFVGFLDASPLDSVNTENLIELIRRLGVENVRGYTLRMEAPSHNLYM